MLNVVLPDWPEGKLSGTAATNPGRAGVSVMGNDIVAFCPALFGSGMVADIEPVPGTASCVAFMRTLVMMETSQLTAGVDVVSVVQYSSETGVVNTCVDGSNGNTLPFGFVNVIDVVFRKLCAFRKISCTVPPAAIMLG